MEVIRITVPRNINDGEEKYKNAATERIELSSPECNYGRLLQLVDVA